DVEEDDRELLLEQVPERLLARGRGDEAAAERLQARLEREQVLGPVVDEEDAAHVGTPASARQRLATNGPISSSGRTVGAPAAIAASGIARRSAVAGSWTIARPPRSAIRRRP